MTRKEFLDYHFRVHGSKSDEPRNPDEKPHKYIQTHFFDAAFGERPDSVGGTGNHPWVGRDDMTELYFRDWDHLKTCFSSEHVRNTVGPDGLNFNDLETAIPLLAVEKRLHFNTSISSSSAPKEGSGTVAVLFLAVKTPEPGEQLEKVFSPALIDALEGHATNEVWGLVANVGVPSTQFDIRAYFGGKNMPEYPVSYKIYMKDDNSVTAVRKAQNAFMESIRDRIDASNTFITFGKEGLVLDVEKGIKFDKNQQPQIL
ncbi:Nn.00g066190.m01.CDS01 [Neocucurbitaria sp. VM-36]